MRRRRHRSHRLKTASSRLANGTCARQRRFASCPSKKLILSSRQWWLSPPPNPVVRNVLTDSPHQDVPPPLYTGEGKGGGASATAPASTIFFFPGCAPACR